MDGYDQEIWKKITFSLRSINKEKDLSLIGDLTSGTFNISCRCMKHLITKNDSKSQWSILKRHTDTKSHQLKCAWIIKSDWSCENIDNVKNDIRGFFKYNQKGKTKPVAPKRPFIEPSKESLINGLSIQVEAHKIATNMMDMKSVEVTSLQVDRINEELKQSQHSNVLQQFEDVKRCRREIGMARTIQESQAEVETVKKQLSIATKERDGMVMRILSMAQEKQEIITLEAITQSVENITTLLDISAKHTKEDELRMISSLAIFSEQQKMIQDTKRAFLNLDLCHPNAYSRNTQQYEGNVLELASKITKIKSDSNQQTLYKFIEDVLSNIGKSGKRWSDSTQTLFATVLNYGGKKIAQMLSKDLCGPSTQTMYRQARMSYLLPMSIENRAFAYASNLYKIWKFKGPFILAIDGTVIIPSLRIRSNQIIGFASNETFHVTTADEIVNLLHVRKIVKANQANLILLVPVIDGVPWCIISIQPVVKGENWKDIKQWFEQSRTLAKKNSIDIIGLAADGDSKYRKYFLDTFKSTPTTVTLANLDLAIQTEKFLPPCIPFSDWKHLVKKIRNQLLNVRKTLILGDHLILLEHLMQSFESKKLKSGLWKTDVYVRDKQNVDAATRILRSKVRKTLLEEEESGNQNNLGTRVYLKIGAGILEAYEDKTLGVKERVKKAWAAVVFFKLWKSWIDITKVDVDKNFITNQTYNDVIIAGNTIILTYLLFHRHYPEVSYSFHLLGSDCCEQVFSKLRGFVRGKPAFTMLDMLDYAARLQRLNELNVRTLDKKPMTRVENIEELIKKGMSEAEIEVVSTIKRLGMVDDLVTGRILAKQDQTILLKNVNFHGWNVDLTEPDEPDENDVVDFEIDDVDDATAAAQDPIEENLFNDLLDVTSELVVNSKFDKEQVEEIPGTIECALFVKGKCLHVTDKKTKNKKKINWIQCEFPRCEKWYHYECVGIKFKSNDDTLHYHFDCPVHDGDGNQVYRVKVAPDDADVLQDDGQSTSDDLRREVSGRNKGEWRPRYVFWEGNYYHIARFLSLQMGKNYTPAASRQERWRSTNSTSYFEKLGCKYDGIEIGSIIVYRVDKKVNGIGFIVRIAQRFGTKAIHPTLSLEKDRKFDKIIFTVRNISFMKNKAVLAEPLRKNIVTVKGDSLVTEVTIKMNSSVTKKNIALLKKYKIKLT